MASTRFVVMSISKREPFGAAPAAEFRSKTPSTAMPRRVRSSASWRSVVVRPGRNSRSQELRIFIASQRVGESAFQDPDEAVQHPPHLATKLYQFLCITLLQIVQIAG